jgi:CDI immunity protein
MIRKANITLVAGSLRVQTIHASGVTDPNFDAIELNNDADDITLGEALSTALEQYSGPAIGIEVAPMFAVAKERFEAWQAAAIKKVGYKNKTQLWKGAQNVSVWFEDGQIQISPSIQKRHDNFMGSKELEKVIVSAASTPAQIGAAVRLALSRCK